MSIVACWDSIHVRIYSRIRVLKVYIRMNEIEIL